MLQCYSCLETKQSSEFYSKKKLCKKCNRAKSRAWAINNPERYKKRQKTYYLKHKQKLIDRVTNARKNKPEQYKQARINSKEKIKKTRAVWRAKNIDKVREARRLYEAKKSKDPKYRLINNLRKRLGRAIKNNQKAGSAVSDLGCSIEFFKQYLESKFQSGMSWDNWGRKGWHIDHITPLSSFDLTNRAQFLKACHYTNLQPLWWEENLSKNAKLTWSSNE